MRLRSSGSTDPRAALALARETGVTAGEARMLLATERVLPFELTVDAAQRLGVVLRNAGVGVAEVDAPSTNARCAFHPRLTPDGNCSTCRNAVCPLCLPTCPDCAGRAARSATWKWRRVAVLLAVFAVLAGTAFLQMRRRASRSEWKRPVTVSVVLQSASAIEPKVVRAWRDGLAELDGWFTSMGAKWQVGIEGPVRFVLVEPAIVGALPAPPNGDALDAVRFRRELAKLAPEKGDIRLVVSLGHDAHGIVEGVAEAGGDIGLVRVSSSDTRLGLELEAVAHETLHCLGALDAYDEDGHAIVPDGLAEPARGFPQRAAEVMCGEIPLAPGRGRVPTSLHEVMIGPQTAQDIGWVPGARPPPE